MSDRPPNFRVAGECDLPGILRLSSRFCTHEQLAFNHEEIAAALLDLLRNPSLGRIVIAEAENTVAGYAVLAFGYSIEFRGRDAFIDELYLEPPFRGKGWGRLFIEHLAAYAASLGIKALHLEVDHDNGRAQRLYASSGFTAHRRFLMTRMLRVNQSGSLPPI